MNLKFCLAPAAALLALAVAPAAHAQTFFATNTTVTTAVTGNAAIGFSGKDSGGNYIGPANNTVTLAVGSSVDYFLIAYNASSVIMNAGSITGDVYAFDSSNLSFRGGTVAGNIFAYTNSTLDFDGSLTTSTVASTFAGFRAINISGNLNNGSSNTAINKTVYLHDGSTVKLTINGVNMGQGGPTITPVPEPGSVALLLGLGVTGAGFAAKRRKCA